MSVGLLLVRLLYRFYVCVHLSKWFTFSVFLSVIFCRVVVFYACTQRPAACRSGGFSAPKLLNIPELSTSKKVSKNALNPPFLQTAVVRSAFYLISLSFLKASFVEFNRITGNSSIFVSSFPMFVAKK